MSQTGQKIKYLNYIHPLNRARVEELAVCIAKHPAVETIRIFGSSVRADCHNESDVDIYVELDKPVKNAELVDEVFWYPYDLWTNFSVDEHLRKEIMDTSVMVYMREDRA